MQNIAFAPALNLVPSANPDSKIQHARDRMAASSLHLANLAGNFSHVGLSPYLMRIKVMAQAAGIPSLVSLYRSESGAKDWR